MEPTGPAGFCRATAPSAPGSACTWPVGDELSIITGQPATAGVAARGKCFVLFLPRVEFRELIMTHPQVLEHISAVAEARRREIGRVNLL